MASAGESRKFKVSNSYIGKCICVFVCVYYSNSFLQGSGAPVIPLAYGIFISQPIY
jgi:hypothetical protein